MAMAGQLDETSKGSSVEEKKSRKRLVPWLYKMLNSENIPGLRWRNREEKIWQLPWKVHSQTRWGDEDAFMLRESARALYQYEGDEPDQAELSLWKERLRNNLRSLNKDVKELKNPCEKKGNSPYKVYKFIENSAENAVVINSRGQTGDQIQQNKTATVGPGLVDSTFSVNNTLRSISSPNNLASVKLLNTHETCAPVPHQQNFNDNNNVPVSGNLLSRETNIGDNGDVLNTCVTAQVQDVNGQIDYFLDEEASEDLYHKLCPEVPSININGANNFDLSPSFRSRSPISHVTNVSEQHDGMGGRQNVTLTHGSTAASCLVDNHEPVMDTDGGQFPMDLSSSDIENVLASPKPHGCNATSTDPKYPLMTVEVHYYNHCVLKQPISDNCFRLAFVENEGDKEAIDTSRHPDYFGKRDVNTVHLPLTDHCQQLTEPQARNVNKVLNNLKRGIIFEYTENKDIVGTRYCKAVPMFYMPNSSQPIKMERKVDLPIKLYDANEVAKTFRVDQQPINSCVNVSFSMTPDKLASMKQVLSVTIYHMEHVRLGKQSLQGRSMSSSMDPVCSLTDSLDKILSLEEGLRNDNTVANNTSIMSKIL